MTFTGFAILVPNKGYFARGDLILMKFKEKVIQTETSTSNNKRVQRKSVFAIPQPSNQGKSPRAEHKNVLKILESDRLVKI